MRRSMFRGLSLLLTVCMLMSFIPTAIGEETEAQNTSHESEQTVYQPIEVTPKATEVLTHEEQQYYSDVAEELKQGNKESTLTVSGEDNVVVYSMKENSNESGETVLQEFTYSTDKSAPLSLTGYAEITLQESSSETLDANDKADDTADTAQTVAGDSEANEIKAEDVDTVESNSVDDDANETKAEDVDTAESNSVDGETDESKVEDGNTDETKTEDVDTAEPNSVDDDADDTKAEDSDAEGALAEESEESDTINEALAAEALALLAAAGDSTTPNNEYNDEYKTVKQTVITAARLLEMVQSGDEFAFTFANKLGFGRTTTEIENNLKTMVDEYNEKIDQSIPFEEPRFIINGVDIVLNKTIEQVSLTKNDDGTYSAVLNDGEQTGYRTSIMIDADASVTIVYDETGEARIERRVSSGKPTDFVIALDVSGSMEWDGRDKAMMSALKVVLEEILQVKENTVSIVFWSDEGAIMQLQVNNSGISQVFSGADGMTAEKLFDASLIDRYGDASSYSLSDATIDQIESLYGFDGGTEPDKGLAKAIDLLKKVKLDNGRNVGVMLFTDGDANYEYSEYETVNLEKQIAESYGATVVNVSIGDEYDVQNYERYLDPQSNNYYGQGDKVLQDHVLYYNIPKLTNQELADRVSEMFEIAFEDITTVTQKIKTETITDGILAAYGSQLIETIPEGFELVQVRGENNAVSYELTGTDADGNTLITFKLDNFISGKDQVVSYCVIPTAADNDIGVTAYADESETVLHAQPVDRIDVPEEDKTVLIRVTKANINRETPLRPSLPKNPQLEREFRDYVKGLADFYYNPAINLNQYYYEAARIKHDWDDGGLFWSRRDNAYSTYNDYKDYDKYNVPVIQSMLIDGIQQKADEIKRNGAERYGLNAAFDPVTGAWEIGGQAVLGQQIYNAEVDNALKQAENTLKTTLVASVADIGVALATGGADLSFAYNAIDGLANIVSDALNAYAEAEYTNLNAALQNSYREMMKEALGQMYDNIDEDMFSEYRELYSELKQKSKRSEDEQTLMEQLEKLLNSIDNMRQKAISDANHDYDMAAETWADSIGLQRVPALSDNEITWKVISETVYSIGKNVFEVAIKGTYGNDTLGRTILTDLPTMLTDYLTQRVKEGIVLNDSNGDGQFDAGEIVANVFDVSGGMLLDIEKLITKQYLKKSGQNTIKALNSEIANAANNLSQMQAQYGFLSTFTNPVSITAQDLQDARNAYDRINAQNMQKIKEVQETVIDTAGGVAELVGDIIDITTKTFDLGVKSAGLADQADNEVYCAYYANRMYHTMQAAEELRKSLDSGEYAKMKDPSYIETADTDELKQFANRVYAVYNMDLIGQADYITLDMQWQYQTNEKYDETMDVCREMWGNIWDKHGPFLGSLEYIVGGWTSVYAYAWVGAQKSEYLKKVNKDAHNGWINPNQALTIYETMINQAKVARLPDKFRDIDK